MKPVYIINGFLESGKTEFIAYTLSQPYFKIPGRTLLILCEEGENEYDPALLKKSKTIVELIEDEADFAPDRLLELDKKYRPERIIVEYNGMWNFKNMRLPVAWTVEQQITIINAATFPTYFTNMKSLLAEMLRKSEMIIFNRCDGIKELSNYKRNVKAINQSADIIFEGKDGEINELMEEELPYDVKAETIALDNTGYGVWYLDELDHPDRYEGKKIRYIAMVMRPQGFRKNMFVPGRMAMTCCAQDMAFLGYACEYADAPSLKEKEWVEVTAIVRTKNIPEYQEAGPVLEAVSVTRAAKPEKEVIDFT